MEAFGPRTVLVAAALHALLSDPKRGTLGMVAEDAITVADACLDRMGLQRDTQESSIENLARLADAAPMVRFCSRADAHDGPCNGMSRKQCPGYPKGE